jgi:hypothetical protein
MNKDQPKLIENDYNEAVDALYEKHVLGLVAATLGEHDKFVRPEPPKEGSKTHELKTDPHPFNEVWEGNKTCEIRYDDRGYRIGDRLVLKETVKPFREAEPDGETKYTGRSVIADVTHVQKGYGLLAGWCVLSIKIAWRSEDLT